MTLLPYIPSGICALMAVAMVFLWLQWRRDRLRYLALERWGISAAGEGTGVPTILVEQDPPVEFRVGDRALYVRPLTHAYGRVFQKELLRYLVQTAKRYEAVLQLVLFEAMDDSRKPVIVGDLFEAISDKASDRALRRLLDNTLLRDPACNPTRLKFRDISKGMAPETIAEVLYVLQVYNCGGYVKKKILFLMEATRSLSPGMTGIQSIRPWKQEVVTAASSSGSASPGTPSGSSPEPSSEQSGSGTTLPNPQEETKEGGENR